MLRCHAKSESWPLREAFEIAREVMLRVPVVVVSLRDGSGLVGQGEAAGVDYSGETPESMMEQIRAVADHLPDDLNADQLANLLPAGGARNALDCALWDLRSAQSGIPASVTAAVAPLRPLQTMVTIGLGTPGETRRRSQGAKGWHIVKVKVDVLRHLDVIDIVREANPDVRIAVDANQSWDMAKLESLLPGLVDRRVELIEQPLACGSDQCLASLASPIPIMADESCTDRASLDELMGRYQAINIKLDKCGGLSEALALAREARRRGLRTMVGNMCGSSLAMAPAFLVGQICDWADLDGPLLQIGDRPTPVRYVDGCILPPPAALWGGGAGTVH